MAKQSTVQTQPAFDSNVLAAQVLGIGVSVRITGVRNFFGLLRRGAHKTAIAAERRLASK